MRLLFWLIVVLPLKIIFLPVRLLVIAPLKMVLLIVIPAVVLLSVLAGGSPVP